VLFRSLRHGTRVARVHELLNERPAWAARLLPDAPFIEAEVVLAVRDEGARALEDVVRRRMPLSLIARPGPWRDRVAALMDGARRYPTVGLAAPFTVQPTARSVFSRSTVHFGAP
jgi:glycerol-3-phosphate dehydrogenase